MIDESSDGLFAGKYRISTARCRGWNYAGSGSYFVTVCTRDRYPWFGYVKRGFICLSEIGAIVADEWRKTPRIRPNVMLDTWVVMPNHLHGIITITPPPCARSLSSSSHHRRNWSAHSLGSVINQFKSICTKRIRAQVDEEFAWQARYHDHIIRNAGELARIRQYIFNNPRVWNDGMPHQSG